MKYLAAFFLFFSVWTAQAKVTLVREGKPVATIIASGKDKFACQAATLLQDFVRRISGAELPIEYGKEIVTSSIVFVDGPISRFGEDWFHLKSEDGSLYITNAGDKAALYAVVTLLEDYMGVNYYGPHACVFEPRKDIALGEIDRTEIPAFRYRQSQCYGLAEDPIYKIWMRFEYPSDEFAGNMWVHTFDRILPSDVYGKSHPEYYSFINGERRPGKASQWCLTNPEVFEIVSEKIDSIFKANPGRDMISVSQNDGNHTNCTCPDCKALDDYEGGPSGSLIHFMNRLGERFPDKQFSTLAYLYTMHPPKHVKPLPNVNIMLCDIDCMREVPLTDNASGREFMKAMQGWAAISENIFVWDYGINFDNYVAPFPNFPILQRNIQLFKENNATMHFSQIGGSKGGDFSEMRAWMVSKLMWNPYLDADSLMRSFMDGYYGAAANYIYQYEKLLEGGLLASGIPLWIYDSPNSHKNGMLNANCRKRYNELFDQAELVVAHDTVLLDRVRLSRLPLQYSELEIARAEGITDPDAIREKLCLFERRTREFDISTLNERNNPPAEYCELYLERYMPKSVRNLARNAKVNWLTEPTGKYRAVGESALTDELFGGTTFVESWVGWEGVDGAFILDLGGEVEISSIEGDFLHQLGQWILLPARVTYSVSSDNERYSLFGEKVLEEDRSAQVKFVGVKCSSPQPVYARYIKVEIEGVKTCPSWHYGVGYPAWFFIDEVTVL